MRLSCPNCSAEYDVPDGMLPAVGRHVQCTVCHTRWFARGAALPAPSEDQVVARLEGRTSVASATGAAQPGQPGYEPGDETPAAGTVVPLRPADSAKPAERPTVPLPSSVSVPTPPPRTAPRLDLDPAPRPAPPPSAKPEPRGRFALGLLLPTLLFLLALGAYDFRRTIATEVPAVGPVLEDYAGRVDALRTGAEPHIAPLRARLTGARG